MSLSTQVSADCMALSDGASPAYPRSSCRRKHPPYRAGTGLNAFSARSNFPSQRRNGRAGRTARGPTGTAQTAPATHRPLAPARRCIPVVSTRQVLTQSATHAALGDEQVGRLDGPDARCQHHAPQPAPFPPSWRCRWRRPVPVGVPWFTPQPHRGWAHYCGVPPGVEDGLRARLALALNVMRTLLTACREGNSSQKLCGGFTLVRRLEKRGCKWAEKRPS